MKVSYASFLAALAASGAQAAKPRVRAVDPLKGSAGLTSKQNSNSAQKKGGSSGGAADAAADFSAVYTMLNQPVNAVLVFSRDTSTGALTFEASVPTGGVGGTNNPNTGPPGNFPLPPGVDPFGAQDGIQVAGRCVLACNNHSHEITSLYIHSASTITVASNVPSGGTWPISVTAADENDNVYVLNGGGQGSVQGFHLDPDDCTLEPVGRAVFMEQGGGPTNAINVAPDNPPSTLAGPCQIGFTPAGDVMTLVAAIGGGQNGFGPGAESEGSLNIFPKRGNGELDAPIRTLVNDPTGTFPLAFVNDAQGRLLVAELTGLGAGPASTGVLNGAVLVFEYGEEVGEVTQVDRVFLNEPLTCWLKYNSANQCTYTTNTLPDGSVSSVKSTAEGVTLVESRAADGLIAPIDIVLSADNNHAYVLTGGLNLPEFGVPGDGMPRINVFSTDADCGMELVEEHTDGFPTQQERIDADGAANGVVGLATFPAPQFF